MPGYYDADGKWHVTQGDPQATPGESTRAARGEGGLGSTKGSDINGALAANGQAPLPSQFHPLETVQNNAWNAREARELFNNAMAWKPTASATHAGPVTIDRSAEGATNAMQMAQLARMQQNALGKGPSVANALGQAGYDSTLRAQMGAGKGGGALGLRGVVGAGGAMHGDNAAKFAAMRAGEQQSGYGALAGAAFGTRGASLAGDIDQAKINQQLAMTNAGADQAVALANQRAQMQAFGNQLGAAGLHGKIAQDQFGAELGYDGMRTAKNLYDAEKMRREAALEREQIATGMQVVGSMAAFASDERVKTNIKPGDSQLRAWLEAIAPHEYEYKDTSITGTRPGKHVSPMAQEIERSEIGKSAVFDAPEGHKMVDYSKMAPAQLAATAWLHKRLDKLEKKAR